MIGDNRVRFCPQCKLNVYNFSAMAEIEIQRLIARRDGRLCARWYRRADGTILTSDCPIGFRAKVKRVSRVAGAAFSGLSMLLGAGPLFAQNQPRPSQSRLVQIEDEKHGNREIFVRVEDQTGAVVPNASVALLNVNKAIIATGKTDEKGEFRAVQISPGHYSVRAESPGFAVAEIEATPQKINEEGMLAPLVITLRVGIMGEVVTVSKTSLAHRIFSKLR